MPSSTRASDTEVRMAESTRPEPAPLTDQRAASTEVAEVAAVEAGTPQDFEVALQSLTQWQLAYRRFRRHRLATVGTVFMVGVILVAIFAPILWPYDPTHLPGVTKPGG